MAYTEEELKQVQTAIAEFNKFGEEAQERVRILKESLQTALDDVEKKTKAAEDYLKKQDEKYMAKYGMTAEEFRKAHKDELNEYILSHPEEFGEDPYLIE